MKKIISKIAMFASFVTLMIAMSPITAHASSSFLDPVFQTPDISEEALETILILYGISILVPTIICLFLIYIIDRGDTGNGKSVFHLIGIGFLMMVPIVSTVFLFIWACGSKTKSDPTFRSWAKLMLLGYLFSILFVVTYFVTSFALLGTI